MAKTRSEQVLTFAVLGLVSGILTCCSGFAFGRAGGFVKEAWPLFIGVIFGVVVASHVWITGISRSIWRLVNFALAATVAYAFAFLGSATRPFHTAIFNNVFGNENGPYFAVCFSGGVIGGAIFFLSFLTLIASGDSWKESILKFLAFSMVSGFLGMFAWGFGFAIAEVRSLLHLAGSSGGRGAENFLSLYVLWQIGAGMMLAYLLPSPESDSESSAEISEKKTVTGIMRHVLPVSVILFVLAGMWFLVRKEGKGYEFGVRYRARQEEAQRRAIAERPSLENLPEIPAQNVERLIVLHSIHNQEIDGMSANQRGTRNARADGRPPSVAYYASYGSMDGRFHPGYVPLVRAIVMVYPSAEWAQYELRNIPTFNSSILDPERTISATKYGNKIIMNTSMRYPDGSGDLYFFWRSGEKIVLLIFQKNEDDEFLREYMELHPSSL